MFKFWFDSSTLNLLSQAQPIGGCQQERKSTVKSEIWREKGN